MGWLVDEGPDSRDTELRHRLEEVSRRLEETEEMASVGSWEWKLPELRAQWSRQLLRIFGRDPAGEPPDIDELIAAVHPDDRAGFQALVARVRQTPGPFRYSYRIVDARGETRYLQARGRTIADARGMPTRSYGTTQDITELRRSEEQLERAQRLESVGQLAGGIAHDFNNLLSVILNNAEHLADLDEEGGGRAAGLREIERAATSGAELTRRLLLFGRREATGLRLVNLVEAVREAEVLLARTIGGQIELIVDAPARVPPVKLETGQLEQILVNLALNSRDAMPAGGRIVIRLRGPDAVRPEHEPLPDSFPGVDHVVLSVADEGVGMSSETVTRAFDPFFTTKPRGKGTGLGLASVYGIVRQAGGQIEIDSSPGQGTTISIFLPASSESDSEEAEEVVQVPSTRGEGRVVLVVDNEPAVRTVVGHMLKRHDYRVLEAGDAAEAEAVLASDATVDLLLTDVMMPGVSGRGLVARLAARGSLPAVIYMSGFAGDDHEFPGGDAIVLEKPFKAAKLLSAVAARLEDAPPARKEDKARE